MELLYHCTFCVVEHFLLAFYELCMRMIRMNVQIVFAF